VNYPHLAYYQAFAIRQQIVDRLVQQLAAAVFQNSSKFPEICEIPPLKPPSHTPRGAAEAAWGG
jgi:hypothetical protein